MADVDLSPLADKTKGSKNDDTLARSGIAGAVADTVQRHGSAVKGHFVALGGVDHETGTDLTRSLKGIAGYKVNAENVEANLKRQAGYSAEVRAAARENAEAVIAGKTTRTMRTDDMGRMNDHLYDHVKVDADGNIIAGSGTQMKFVGKTPRGAFKYYMSPKCQKYRDNNVPIEAPSDFYDSIKDIANDEIASLRKQADALVASGKTELAQSRLARIKEIEKVRDTLKRSSVSNKDALEARVSPKMSTAKDIGNALSGTKSRRCLSSVWAKCRLGRWEGRDSGRAGLWWTTKLRLFDATWY